MLKPKVPMLRDQAKPCLDDNLSNQLQLDMQKI